MHLRRALLRIQDDPCSILSSASCLALEAFLNGYKTADAGWDPVLSSLDDAFAGPSSARACTRAYLSSRTEREGLSRVLDALTPRVREGEPVPGPGARSTFVSFARGPIEGGRPGMVLGEPSVTWLFDYSQGYGFGLDAVNPSLASEQRSQVRAFEAWIQDRYAPSSAPWYGVIRVYEGACERGVSRFIELWDEFSAGTGSAGRAR